MAGTSNGSTTSSGVQFAYSDFEEQTLRDIFGEEETTCDGVTVCSLHLAPLFEVIFAQYPVGTFNGWFDLVLLVRDGLAGAPGAAVAPADIATGLTANPADRAAVISALLADPADREAFAQALLADPAARTAFAAELFHVGSDLYTEDATGKVGANLGLINTTGYTNI